MKGKRCEMNWKQQGGEKIETKKTRMYQTTDGDTGLKLTVVETQGPTEHNVSIRITAYGGLFSDDPYVDGFSIEEEQNVFQEVKEGYHRAKQNRHIRLERKIKETQGYVYKLKEDLERHADL